MKYYSSETRTDLASELIKSKVTKLNEHVSRTDVDVDDETAKKIGKAAGRYTTVTSAAVAKGEREYYDRIIYALENALKEYTGKRESCMVVGLGNPSMTADALGNSVVKRIRVTRNIEKEDGKGVCTISRNVNNSAPKAKTRITYKTLLVLLKKQIAQLASDTFKLPF